MTTQPQAAQRTEGLQGDADPFTDPAAASTLYPAPPPPAAAQAAAGARPGSRCPDGAASPCHNS